MNIEVVNWDKYNPRSNAKAWSWFRLQNDFLEDDEFFDLGQTELLLFVYVCCRRSKSAKPVFGINPRKAAQACRCEPNDVLGALEVLERLGKIQIYEWKPDTSHDVRERTHTHAEVRPSSSTNRVETDPYPTDGRTDVTDEQDTPRAHALIPVCEDEKPKKGKTKRIGVTTWDPDDPLASIFSDLMTIPAYAEVFDLGKDRETVLGHMKRHSLSVTEMERITNDLRHHCDGLKKPIDSPRGKLNTFVQNFAERKAKSGPSTSPKSAGQRSPVLETMEDVRRHVHGN